MLERLFGIAVDTSVNVSATIACMLVAVFFGLIIGCVYIAVAPKGQRSLSFFLSLILIPAVVTVVIVLIGSNVARAFSIAGVFALVRFRSIPGDGKDISLIFMSMAAGLACGLGYLTFGATVVVVLSVVILLVHLLGKKLLCAEYRQLRILIPEDMDYQGVFDDLLQAYTKKYSLERIKTTNMGTLYELTYQVLLKENVNEKQLMDDIRCRNGNLTVILAKQDLTQGML